MKKYIIGIGAAVLILGGAALFLFFGNGENNQESFVPSPRALTASLTPARILGSDFKQYNDAKGRFSIEYPADFDIHEWQEDVDAESIVFQAPDDKSDDLRETKKGFQIFIFPFGEEETLTRERILKDLPSLVTEEIQEVILGDGTRALLFWSEDPTIGRTREVWFTRNKGFLYQVTTYAHLDEWLAMIMSTWKFQN